MAAKSRLPPSAYSAFCWVDAQLLHNVQELGPVAVVNDWDNQATSRVLGPSWRSFPSLAGAVMGGEGLLAPVSCSEAFSFEVRSSMPFQHQPYLPHMASKPLHVLGMQPFLNASTGVSPCFSGLEGQHPPPAHTLPCYFGTASRVIARSFCQCYCRWRSSQSG